MKTQLIFLVILVGCSTCSKVNSNRNCEEWEVTDRKSYSGTGFDWSCAGSRTLQLVFCGDALKDASPGNTKIISSGECTTTRTFNRFIKKW
ncbi:hypothetical protein ESA94_17795 [Lacibacter luteus]|uniref:Uncharacterized protein n=1 Tax=Lacibacter luteus TaxID=2508719 RepID=A0A4V1M768_9BACT|nr:hypothetical protein [Lacibacter luteus]RXK58490.1 hypothetical protein ESA94_17795 [Lacibacter luteus]